MSNIKDRNSGGVADQVIANSTRGVVVAGACIVRKLVVIGLPVALFLSLLAAMVTSISRGGIEGRAEFWWWLSGGVLFTLVIANWLLPDSEARREN